MHMNIIKIIFSKILCGLPTVSPNLWVCVYYTLVKGNIWRNCFKKHCLMSAILRNMLRENIYNDKIATTSVPGPSSNIMRYALLSPI